MDQIGLNLIQIDQTCSNLFCFQITRKRSNGLIQAKAQIERKISVSSIMSDDSFSMEHLEEAGQAIGAAVGFSKVASGLRESRRRKSMSRQDSITPEPDDDDLVIWVVNFQIIFFFAEK